MTIVLSMLTLWVAGAVECSAPTQAPPAESIFALLIAHPEAPPGLGLPRLTAVEDDLIRMHRLFDGLGAEAIHTHLQPSQTLVAKGPRIAPRPPTFRALKTSVLELVAQLARHTGPRPSVYIYYSGHGRRSWTGGVVRTTIYLQPDPWGRTELGDDGRIDSKALAAALLDPLEPLANVHLIVDACQSYFLLEPRGVQVRKRTWKLHPGKREDLKRAFVEAHPHTGAVLATNGSQATFERPDLGGLFSFAVRSAVLGPGDLNQDGVVSYNEVEATIQQVLASQGGSGPPGVIGVGGHDDAPFVNLARPGLAQMCLTPEDRGRYELFDEAFLAYGVVHPAREGQTPLYLPSATQWRVRAQQDVDGPARWFRISAAAGPFGALPQHPLKHRAKGTQDEFVGQMMPSPLSRALDEVVSIPPPQPEPENYVGVGVAGTLRVTPGGGPAELDHAQGVELPVRIGFGRHQLLLAAGWARGRGRVATGSDTGLPFTADIADGRVGYGLVVYDGRFEAQAQVHTGASGVFQAFDSQDSTNSLPGTSALGLFASGGVSVLFPVQPDHPLAISGSLHGGLRYLCTAGCSKSVVSPIVWFSLGVEWELPL